MDLGYYHADKMGSDYVDFFYKTRRGSFFFCIWRLSINHITQQGPVIHLQFLTVLPLGGLKKSLI